MRSNTIRLVAASAAVAVCFGMFATVASAAPRNAASKMAGRDFRFNQPSQMRTYRVYRAPVNIVESAPIVAQTPAPAANENATPQATAENDSATRRFSAEPSENVTTPSYNYYQPRRATRGFQRDFSANRKITGGYLP